MCKVIPKRFYLRIALILRTPALEACSFFITKVPIVSVLSTCGPPQSSCEYTVPLFPVIVYTFTMSGYFSQKLHSTPLSFACCFGTVSHVTRVVSQIAIFTNSTTCPNCSLVTFSGCVKSNLSRSGVILDPA